MSDGLAGSQMFHGTSQEAAQRILGEGVIIEKSGGGYFGIGFYAALDLELARSNYADLADDGGCVLAFELSKDARILDLRDASSWIAWSAVANGGKEISDPQFHLTAVQAGLDGVYDNSIGGVCLFNPMVVDNLRVVPAERNLCRERETGH